MTVYYFIFYAISLMLFCGLGYTLGRIDGYSNGIQYAIKSIRKSDQQINEEKL